MFFRCESLTDINVSTWDTSKVEKMNEIFKGCASLEVLDLSNWTSESIKDKANYHMGSMLGIGLSMTADDCKMTPLKEITLGPNFKFSLFQSPGLRGGLWHLKEGTEEQISKRYTPERLYRAYNNGNTPGEGYSYSHTYVLTEINDDTIGIYRARGVIDDNTWLAANEDARFHTYCINTQRPAPNGGYYDRTIINDPSVLEDGYFDNDQHGYAPLGNDMREALITLVYFGYGNDPDGIQERYNLSDRRFQTLTQSVIWAYTNHYTGSGIDDLPETSDYNRAYNELKNKKFADIPDPDKEKLRLYVYESLDGRQNLISISGIATEPLGGIRIQKLGAETTDPDSPLTPLPGAKFKIYRKEDGTAVKDSKGNDVVITSDENGYASFMGLSEGTYTIREYQAPRGFINSGDYYIAYISVDDDGVYITEGLYKNTGVKYAMVFKNDLNDNVKGGGIKLQKTDDNGKALEGVVFEIRDENETVIETLITDKNGFAYTGKKDLELNKSYTLVEVQGVKGYKPSSEVKSFVLVEDNKYYDEIFEFINQMKKGKAIIEVTKEFNVPLQGDDFTFELIDVLTGDVIATAKNNKDGKIKFEVEVTAKDMDYHTYLVREVVGDNKDIVYDKHEEEIVVLIEDNGKDELDCTVVYQIEGIFKNEFVDPLVDITINKIWDDNNDSDGNRPQSIAVDILANGKVISTVILNAKNSWSYTLEQLDMYDSEGKLINYTVKENIVLKDYSVTYSKKEYNFTITNTYNKPDEPSRYVVPKTGIE